MRRSPPRGFTLFELLITVTILLLVMPAIIGSIVMTQRTTNRSNQETVLRQTFRVQLDRILLDVREARAIFNPANVSISANFAITDGLPGLTLPNGTDVPAGNQYLNWPARGTALALMKYEDTVAVGGTQADTYKIVAYYLKNPQPGDAEYDGANPQALCLRRFVSSRTYMDMSLLNGSQQSAATGLGYRAWTPQGEGRTPTLPESKIPGASRMMINAIAPGDAWVRGQKVPPPGGFGVNRDGNLITVYLAGYAAGQTYVLQSQTAARNFVL